MTPDFFETIVQQAKDYTDYIYLHVQGEPTLLLMTFLPYVMPML